MRLYLINLVLNPNKDDDIIDRGITANWRGMTDVISGLRGLGLVSTGYGIRHLNVDTWFLQKCTTDPTPELTGNCLDYHSLVMFYIILQALKDLRAGRPCDCGIWVQDDPPDSRRCLKTEHICYQHAEEYLRGLQHIDCMVNLSDDFLQNLVRKIKSDPIFRIESLFV
jgi:hypothetical protein